MTMLLKKISKICLVFMFMSVVLLTGCADLGDFEDIDDYYNSFGEVTLSVTNSNKHTFDVQEFYNEESQEDFSTDVQFEEYVYFSVKVLKPMEMDTFSMYFLGNSEVLLQMSIFVVDELPASFREYDDPAEDEEGNPIEYDDVDEANKIKDVNLLLKTDQWNSFSVETFGEEDDSKINVNDGQFIVIRFNNNSFIGKELSLDKVSFKMTNMMVRCLAKED